MDLLDVWSGQQGWRTAAPVDMRRPQAWPKLPRDQSNFVDEGVHIATDWPVSTGHARVTAAVPAHLAAERDVKVDRDRLFRRDTTQPGSIFVRPNCSREVRSGRITRIARDAHGGV